MASLRTPAETGAGGGAIRAIPRKAPIGHDLGNYRVPHKGEQLRRLPRCTVVTGVRRVHSADLSVFRLGRRLVHPVNQLPHDPPPSHNGPFPMRQGMASKRSGTPRRFRLSLRALIVCMTIIGAACGWIGREVYLKSVKAAGAAVMFEQFHVTRQAIDWNNAVHVSECRAARNKFWNPGGKSAACGRDWSLETKVVLSGLKDQSVVAVFLDVEGRLDPYRPVPITIRDRGGPYNEELIKRLTEAYDEKKWAYQIVSDVEAAEASSAAATP